MFTDRAIKEAIEILSGNDRKFKDKIKRHSQHSKKHAKYWASFGCKHCEARFLEQPSK